MYVIELAELMLGFNSFLQDCQPVKKWTMVKQVIATFTQMVGPKFSNLKSAVFHTII
jgi:hypothetical protein